MDIFDRIALDMNQDIRDSGGTSNITGESVKKTIELAWDEARKNKQETSSRNNYVTEDLYSPRTEEKLQQKIDDIGNQSKLALSEARNAVFQANKAIEEAQVATKQWKRNKRILTGVIFVVIISFLGWLYTSIISVQEATHTFYQKGIELERKITEYDEKIKIVEERQKELEQGINDKIAAEINKRIVEFVLKDKQVKVIE